VKNLALVMAYSLIGKAMTAAASWSRLDHLLRTQTTCTKATVSTRPNKLHDTNRVKKISQQSQNIDDHDK